VTADLRAERARAYLAAARRRDLTGLPWSARVRELVAELAEARQVLAFLLTLADDLESEEEREACSHIKEDGEAWLVPADALVLGQALPDAIAHRNEHAGGECGDCDTDAAGLCAQGAADLDQADAYTALARALGIEVDR
jgi:hypothetical protein